MTEFKTRLLTTLISASILLSGCATTFSEHEAKYKDLNIDNLLNTENVSTADKDLLQASLIQRATQDNLSGRTSSAVKHAEMALKFAPEASDAKQIIAEARLQQGRFEDSELLFSELLVSSPSDTVNQGYGLALLGQNKTGEAEPWLNKAVSSDAALWRSWNGLGIIHDLSGDWVLSEKSYKAAITAAAGKPVLHYNLGLSYLKQNKLAASIFAFEEARALSNNDRMDVNYRTALALFGKMERAQQGASDLELAELYNNLGTRALESGQNEKAIDYLKTAIAKSPSHYAVAIQNLYRAQSALP